MMKSLLLGKKNSNYYTQTLIYNNLILLLSCLILEVFVQQLGKKLIIISELQA